MKPYRIIGTLTLVAILSGGLLAWANGIAAPLIRKNRRDATRAAVLKVLPGTKSVTQIPAAGLPLFEGKDNRGEVTGFAFEAVTSGFQGEIKMMVGVDSKIEKITGLEVVENLETPGLGNRIAETGFQNQFVGLATGEKVVLVKNQPRDKNRNEIEAITGATISSQAVVDGLNKWIAKAKKAKEKADEP